MADRDDALIKLHEDVPLFREAIAFTAAKTGFNGQVISISRFRCQSTQAAANGAVPQTQSSRPWQACRSDYPGSRAPPNSEVPTIRRNTAVS